MSEYAEISPDISAVHDLVNHGRRRHRVTLAPTTDCSRSTAHEDCGHKDAACGDPRQGIVLNGIRIQTCSLIDEVFKESLPRTRRPA